MDRKCLREEEDERMSLSPYKIPEWVLKSSRFVLRATSTESSQGPPRIRMSITSSSLSAAPVIGVLAQQHMTDGMNKYCQHTKHLPSYSSSSTDIYYARTN